MLWLGLLALLGFLMVSTWRYYSFKGIGLNTPYTPLLVIAVAGLIYSIWNYGQVVLPALMVMYVGSGIAIRIGGSIRRRLRHGGPGPSGRPAVERQLG